MYNEYDNEKNEHPGYGYEPPKLADNEREAYAPVDRNDKGAPAGAPAERIDAPIPDKIGNVPRRFGAGSRDRVFAPRADEWSEPNYSQAQDNTSNMYTPGIYANNSYARRHMAEVEPERGRRESRGLPGRIVRMACVVLLCVIFSGAATYGVMEYRFSRGDFTVVNQVILGGSTDREQSGGLSSAVTIAGKEMQAEDLYTMACTQVVSIKTEVGSPDSIFGGAVNTVVAGSGFIISSDGYILTNYHVIETAYKNDLLIKVCLNDGTEYFAKVIGYEENNDIAVIKIDVTGLNPAVIADSDRINVGQKVYAVGNPFGELVYTMTEGIVSARDREVSVEGKTINTFQFSAAVNSGNSGGPLYDANGEVIGIVTAKPMRSSVEGIGFAIPINDALEIAAELIEFGYITGRPLMGITAQTVSNAHAEFYDWVIGAYVRSISEGSAAETAGMKVSDIIIKLGDTEIDSMETLIFALRKFRAGDTTTIIVWRTGEEVELTITFDEDLTAGQPRQQQQQQQQQQPQQQQQQQESWEPQVVIPPDDSLPPDAAGMPESATPPDRIILQPDTTLKPDSGEDTADTP